MGESACKAEGAGSGSCIAFKARRESLLTSQADFVLLFRRLVDAGTVFEGV